MGKKRSAAPAAKEMGSVVEYKISKSMSSKLDPAERAGASKHLWTKSGGLCALCGTPLDLSSPDTIAADHRIPEAKGGKTTLANLYLAHKSCNSSRQHLSFEVAQPLIKFRSLAEHVGAIDFDRVLDEFLPNKNRMLVGFEWLNKDGTPGLARLSFGHSELTVPVWVDPATSVPYFFAEVPAEYVHNDRQIQPRSLMASHVRKLALDFIERPVHEPSNCRLVMEGAEAARLLQFDGQHKTTAQVLIGRRALPMKVYIEPSIDLLQALVIKIQQEIKKQPLTKSETLAKIGDVIGRYLSGYSEPAGQIRSEKGLVNSQRKEDRRAVKELYLDDLMRIVFFDEENRLSSQVRPGVTGTITTDKVVVQKIIKPLLFTDMLEVDLDSSTHRDIERKNIIFILNAIADQMLPPTWNKAGSDVQKRRAENFFYQGSIGWWMGEFLVPGLKFTLMVGGDKKPLLTNEMDESQRSRVLKLVESICSLPIWTTSDPEHLRAMRSNTVRNVEQAFPDVTLKAVLEKVLN